MKKIFFSTLAAILFMILFIGIGIVIGMDIEGKHNKQGSPMHISELKKGEIYTKLDKHENIILFLVKGTDMKVAFLPEECPKRFTIKEINGEDKIIAVPPDTPKNNYSNF